MPKVKLTKESIQFIINKYECKEEIFTFPTITKLIKDEFNIDVTRQTVEYSYKKNKEKFKISELNNVKLQKDKEDELIKESSLMAKSVNSEIPINKHLKSKTEIQKKLDRLEKDEPVSSSILDDILNKS